MDLSQGKLGVYPFRDEIRQLGLHGFARRISEALPHELD